MIPKNIQEKINDLVEAAFEAGFGISHEGFNGEICVHGNFDEELENYMETIKVADRDKL